MSFPEPEPRRLAEYFFKRFKTRSSLCQMTSVGGDLREPSVTLTALDWSNSNKEQHIILTAAEQPSTELGIMAAKQN